MLTTQTCNWNTEHKRGSTHNAFSLPLFMHTSWRRMGAQNASSFTGRAHPQIHTPHPDTYACVSPLRIHAHPRGVPLGERRMLLLSVVRTQRGRHTRPWSRLVSSAVVSPQEWCCQPALPPDTHVLVLGWLGAQARHVDKYAQWYRRCGASTVTQRIAPMWTK